ncbi:MAG: hypothetical protein KAR11_03335 [Phycisphaerae bacterium]|nr:hypothetical protein [Phycisphaerae bacterium]
MTDPKASKDNSYTQILVTTGFFVPFTRLFAAVDSYANISKMTTLVQGDNIDFQFQHATHVKVVNDIRERMLAAEVVIAHGAMTLVEALEIGAHLVAVPRQHKYNEHINDHQVYFAKWLSKQYGFPVVLDIKDLPEAIRQAKQNKPQVYKSKAQPLKDFLSAKLALWDTARKAVRE